MTNLREVLHPVTCARGAAVAAAVFLTIILGLATAPRAQAQLWTLDEVYNFCSQSGCADGGHPLAGLVQGSDGNFYGTANLGGAFGAGTVYKITPGGTLTALYSFCSQSGCADGSYPAGALVQGSDGNFYGTTSQGGAHGYGTVFKITPSGTLTTLYSFGSQSGDGGGPLDTLAQGTDGNFYGTTSYGGANPGPNGAGGTVFSITPDGTLTTLYSFCSQNGCTDGATPYAGLLQGSDGNFYGTTEYGGANNPAPYCMGPGKCIRGAGTVFKINASGTLTTLYSFCSQGGALPGGGRACTDGIYPYAGLVQGKDGNFYGTTAYAGDLFHPSGGYWGGGTFFQITPSGLLTTLFNFGPQGGYNPYGRVTQGSDGNFYGSTYYGGNWDWGQLFQITPGGGMTPLHRFDWGDGANPWGLVEGSDGDFYGITQNGGANGAGTIFRVFPGRPLAQVSPSGLAFLYQDVGTPSLPEAVTLVDTGSATLTAIGVTISGDFAQTNDCGAFLPAGGSCTISVTFVPTAAGPQTGTLTIADNSNARASQQMVTLRGTGVFPLASLSTSGLPFPNQAIGTTSMTKSVTLTSSGGNLTFAGITIIGPDAGDFAATDNCPPTLKHSGSCAIDVTFTPRTLGAKSATLRVNDNAVMGRSTVVLGGKGVLPASLLPASAAFSTWKVGTSSGAKVFDLTNNLSTALENITISTTGDFAVSPTTCGASLAPHSNCSISVTFTPTAAGTRTGTLTVSDAASNSPQVAPLTGTGN